MSAGDRWRLPDQSEALELERSGGLLRVAPIVPHWPFPSPPVIVAARQCTRLPSRYLHGEIPQDEEALL